MTQPKVDGNAGDTNPPPNQPGSDALSAQASSDETGQRNNQVSRLLNSRPTMFLMLFCVTGFLGIPFLLKSQAFSRTEKLIWSIIVTIYTCVLIWITGAVLWWSYSRIRAAYALVEPQLPEHTWIQDRLETTYQQA